MPRLVMMALLSERGQYLPDVEKGEVLLLIVAAVSLSAGWSSLTFYTSMPRLLFFNLFAFLNIPACIVKYIYKVDKWA